ncbi:hypothetical protein VKT23_008609 [Stygiomarasmius scandens]|uniref:Uncharacterized protein n=1 Tax=Marasmiellus scandens TaxID=2682957 RepID=A0ABR1JHS7_9AGAR
MGNVQSIDDKSSTSFPNSATLDNDIAENASIDAGSGIHDVVDDSKLETSPTLSTVGFLNVKERPNVKRNITLSEFEVSSESESGSDCESVLSDSTSSYQDCGVAFGETSDDEPEYCQSSPFSPASSTIEPGAVSQMPDESLAAPLTLGSQAGLVQSDSSTHSKQSGSVEDTSLDDAAVMKVKDESVPASAPNIEGPVELIFNETKVPPSPEIGQTSATESHEYPETFLFKLNRPTTPFSAANQDLLELSPSDSESKLPKADIPHDITPDRHFVIDSCNFEELLSSPFVVDPESLDFAFTPDLKSFPYNVHESTPGTDQKRDQDQGGASKAEASKSGLRELTHEERIEAAEEEVQEKNEQLKVLREQKEGLEAELDEVREKLCAATKGIEVDGGTDRLQTILKSANEEKARLFSELESCSKVIETRQRELDGVKAELEYMKAEMKEKAEEWEKELLARDGLADELMEEKIKLQKELRDAKDCLTSFRRDFKFVDDRVKDAEAGFEEEKGDKELLKEELAAIGIRLDNALELCIQRENEIKKLELLLKEVKEEKEAMEKNYLADLGAQEKCIKEQGRAVKCLKTDLEHFSMDLGELKAKLKSEVFEAKERELMTLRSELQDAKTQMGDLKEKVEEGEKELLAKDWLADELVDEKEVLKLEIVNARDDLEKLGLELKDKDTRTRELEAKLRDANEKMRSQGDVISDFQSRVGRPEQEHKSQSSSVCSSQQRAAVDYQQEKNLVKIISSLKRKLTDAKAQLETKDRELGPLKAMKEEYSRLQKELSLLKESFAMNERLVGEYKGLISDAEQREKDLLKEVQSVKEMARQAEARGKKYKSELGTTRSQHAAEVAGLEEKLKQAEKERALMEQAESQTDELDTLRMQVETKNTEMDQLKQSLESKDKEMVKLKKDLQVAERRRDRYKAERDGIRDKMRARQGRIEELSNQ